MCKIILLDKRYMKVSRSLFEATLGFREKTSTVAIFPLFAFTKSVRKHRDAARSIPAIQRLAAMFKQGACMKCGGRNAIDQG